MPNGLTLVMRISPFQYLTAFRFSTEAPPRYVSLHHDASATARHCIPADVWGEMLAVQPPRDVSLPPIASHTGNSLRAGTGKRP